MTSEMLLADEYLGEPLESRMMGNYQVRFGEGRLEKQVELLAGRLLDLFGMNASRVKEEVREQLIRYQRECYRVLADAFLGPGVSIQATRASDEPLVQLHNMALVIAATTKEMLATKQLALSNQERLDQAASVVGDLRKRVKSIEQRLQVGTLTEEQAAEIRQRVNAIANEMVKHEPGKTHYQAVYAALGDEVGVTSYKNIPQKGYDGAIAFLDNWLLSLRQLRQNE